MVSGFIYLSEEVNQKEELKEKCGTEVSGYEPVCGEGQVIIDLQSLMGIPWLRTVLVAGGGSFGSHRGHCAHSVFLLRSERSWKERN